MKIVLVQFKAGMSSVFWKHGDRVNVNRTWLLSLASVKAVQQKQNTNFPTSMGTINLPHSSFIKGIYRLINNVRSILWYYKPASPSFCVVMLHSDSCRMVAGFLTVTLQKHLEDYQAVAHSDTALNALNQNNVLHTFSCWQRSAHVV